VLMPPKPCSHCNGSGKAFMKVGVPCPSCEGTGFSNHVSRT
jgi:DnaJ-class molecular chaperone